MYYGLQTQLLEVSGPSNTHFILDYDSRRYEGVNLALLWP